MNEFKLGALYNLLILANRGAKIKEYIFMKKILSSMGALDVVHWDRDSDRLGKFSSEMKRGNVSPGLDIPQAIIDCDFSVQMEKVKKTLIPLVEQCREKLEKSTISLLKEDASIGMDDHIGHTDERFKKASILKNSLSFEELITASLRYTFTNFRVSELSKEELAKYSASLFFERGIYYSREKAVEFAENEDRPLSLSDEERCKTLLKTGFLLEFAMHTPLDLSAFLIQELFPEANSILEQECPFPEDNNLARLVCVISHYLCIHEYECSEHYNKTFSDFYDDILRYCKRTRNTNDYSLICIGVFTGFLFSKGKFNYYHLENIPDDLQINKDALSNVIKDAFEKEYDKEIVFDQIYRFLLDPDKSSVSTPKEETVLSFLDTFRKNCKTLRKAKQLTYSLINESRTVSNHEAVGILKAFASLWEEISDKNSYKKRDYKYILKYNVFPSSLCGNQLLYKALCWDIILHTIIDLAKNKREAVKIAESSIKISAITEREKDVRVFSRVAFEFSCDSNRKFQKIRKRNRKSFWTKKSSKEAKIRPGTFD